MRQKNIFGAVVAVLVSALIFQSCNKSESKGNAPGFVDYAACSAGSDIFYVTHQLTKRDRENGQIFSDDRLGVPLKLSYKVNVSKIPDDCSADCALTHISHFRYFSVPFSYLLGNKDTRLACDWDEAYGVKSCLFDVVGPNEPPTMHMYRLTFVDRGFLFQILCLEGPSCSNVKHRSLIARNVIDVMVEGRASICGKQL